MAQEVVKLTKKNLVANLKSGLTRKDLAEKYNLSTGSINKAMKQMGIEGMRASIVKFVIVEDDDEAVENQQAQIVEDLKQASEISLLEINS
jgi:transposase